MTIRGNRKDRVSVDEEGHFLWCGERWSDRHWNAGIRGVSLPMTTIRIDKRFKHLPSSIDMPGTLVLEELHPDAKVPWPMGRHVDGGKWLWRREAYALSIVAAIPDSAVHGLRDRLLTDVVQLQGRLSETPLTRARIMRAETKSTMGNVVIFHLYPEDFL